MNLDSDLLANAISGVKFLPKMPGIDDVSGCKSPHFLTHGTEIIIIVVELIMQISELSVGGGADVGLTLAATVATRNDSRGPFTVDIPFIYNSSLRLSGSAHIILHC